MQLAEKLAALRKNKGISQLELAEMVGVSRQAVSRWESSTSMPSTENLRVLAELYHVSLEYLLDDTIQETEQKKPEGPKEGSARSKTRIIIGVVLAVLVVALVFAFAASKAENKVHAIKDLEKSEIETTGEESFDFAW